MSYMKEIDVMKIRPLDDRIVVEPVEAEEMTAGGILLPDAAKEKPQKGKIVAVGEGKQLDDGTRTPLSVKKGDMVLYSKYGGTEIKVEGKELLIMRESDVLAKVE
jgi:chaperonin GroES